MINNPQRILADEPTGNLDSKASADILNLLRQLNRELGVTLFLVTPNSELAAHAARLLCLRVGAC